MHVPKHIVETRETIIDIPVIQVKERVVEHPEIHVNEVTRHVPKVVEVQEVVKNVTKVDWQGQANAASLVGSMEAPATAATLPPASPGSAMSAVTQPAMASMQTMSAGAFASP